MSRLPKKLSVLLVEDDKLTREALHEYLQSTGYFHQVVLANDGSMAQQKTENQKFDLIITDLNMPKVRGFELIDHIRHLEKKCPKKGVTPFIIMSEEFTQEQIFASKKWNIKHVIKKPCSSKDFVKKVNEALSSFHGIDLAS